MTTRTLEFKIRMPEKAMLAKLKEIVDSPASDPEEYKAQTKFLAEGLIDTINCCRDLTAMLKRLTKEAVFKEA